MQSLWVEPQEYFWPEAPAWMTKAACAGLPTEWFFLTADPGEGPRGDERHLPGIRVCKDCPVLKECREEAVTDPTLDYGIRGGLTAHQRQRERRRRF